MPSPMEAGRCAEVRAGKVLGTQHNQSVGITADSLFLPKRRVAHPIHTGNPSFSPQYALQVVFAGGFEWLVALAFQVAVVEDRGRRLRRDAFQVIVPPQQRPLPEIFAIEPRDRKP